MDYFSTAMEIKTVDLQRRIISGYAAVHHNIDRVGDIIDPSASVKAVARITSPSDVGVFIGHDSSRLPVGIPQVIQATPRGLYTETYILKGHEGDNLLAVAKDLLDHGLALGKSIGYKTEDSRHETAGRRRVRRLLDYNLKEYSFAAQQAIANPEALVTDVKSRRKALAEGADTAGGALVPADRKGMGMQYRVVEENGKWVVYRDADDNQVVGSYASEALATAVAEALRRAARQPDDEDEDGDDAAAAKTSPPVAEAKSNWSTSFVNTLPNAAFLYVEPGEDDEEGKRVPRSKRHFPYRDTEGKIDLPHLRDAIARIPDSDIPADQKAALQARARRMLDGAGDGKTVDDGEEWKSGAPLTVLAFGYQLLDLAERISREQKAMALLGEDTKDRMRVRSALRDEVKTLVKDLGQFVAWAETLDRGEEAQVRRALLAKRLELLSI